MSNKLKGYVEINVPNTLNPAAIPSNNNMIKQHYKNCQRKKNVLAVSGQQTEWKDDVYSVLLWLREDCFKHELLGRS